MAVAHELADRDDVGQTARGAGSPTCACRAVRSRATPRRR
jgi:hypothetical protein